MMRLVEVVATASSNNYMPRAQVTEPGIDAEWVSMVYERASLNQAFTENASFIDPNPPIGQVFPGFEPTC